jgi:ketosteroid isomerase-like protein
MQGTDCRGGRRERLRELVKARRRTTGRGRPRRDRWRRSRHPWARDTGRAMSQENVEVVRRFLLLEVDEALTYVDPDIVWNPAEESATQGHDAVRASLVRWKSEWDDYELLPEEFEHMGDRVVAAVRLRGRGRGSGIEVDARFYEVYTLREGKILRMDQFTQRSEALEAVGLRE